jgi:hypothetical protein
VNIQFGNDDDTFILDIGDFPSPGVLTGSINGGGAVTVNTFVYVSGNDSATTISNFP